MNVKPGVFGVDGTLRHPDWPPIDHGEAIWALSRWGRRAATDQPVLAWHSPRGLSSAALITTDTGLLFLKRHDARIRTPETLAAEHAFTAHLRVHGILAPEVLLTPEGHSAIHHAGAVGAGFTYELHAIAPGIDTYRQADSWTPFQTLEHAHAAGVALARFHAASAGFDAPARPFTAVSDTVEFLRHPAPLAALCELIRSRPGLTAWLPRDWEAELTEHLAPALAQAAAAMRLRAPVWTHGDWHPSNLTWLGDEPHAVLDLGLSNLTVAVHDLAVAIERSCVSWLEPEPHADLDAVVALMQGYTSVRPLELAESRALPHLLRSAHVAFALSEVELYGPILGSAERAAVAYQDYLLGHLNFFDAPAGRELLGAIDRETGASVPGLEPGT